MTRFEIRETIQEFLHTDEVSDELKKRLEEAKASIKEILIHSSDLSEQIECKAQLGMSTEEGKKAIAWALFDRLVEEQAMNDRPKCDISEYLNNPDVHYIVIIEDSFNEPNIFVHCVPFGVNDLQSHLENSCTRGGDALCGELGGVRPVYVFELKDGAVIKENKWSYR